MTRRKIEYWVIPPDADGEFVANMEEVLETYEKARCWTQDATFSRLDIASHKTKANGFPWP